MRKRLFLIDGSALAYRSYYAFASNPSTALSTATGHPTGATYGFVMTLRAILEREHPDAIAIAFDGPSKQLYRTQVYAEYKSTRNKMPDEMAMQLDDIHEVVEGYGMAIVEAAGHEADDVIATLALRGRDSGLDVFIVTGDKDFLQIAGPHIKLWNLRASTSKPEILGPESVPEKFGVQPEQMVDLLALMGDSSDNVPGVPKVGPKTASELLAQFGTLEALLERASEVKKPAIRDSLQANREQALLSKQLVTLRTDLDLGVEVTGLGPALPQPDRLRPLFQRLEFTTLLKSLANVSKPEDIAQDYRTVGSAAELAELVQRLRSAGTFAIAADTAASGRNAKLTGLAFAMQPGHGTYVPLNLQGANALAELTPLLVDETLGKTCHDAKHFASLLRAQGIEARGLTFDTLLAGYCLQPGSSQSLEAQALRHFGYTLTPPKETTAAAKKQRTFADVDVEEVSKLLCERADFTLRLQVHQGPELEAAQVEALYRELEIPLWPVLLDMEWQGIAIDRPHLAKLGLEFTQRLQELERRVHERAGTPFNLGSPAQLGKVLFDDLEVQRAANLPRPKRTKTGQYKTDAEVLEKLSKHHEVPALVLEWRELSKLKGTYVDTLPQMVDASTGRIHTTFNQAVAATGRLSSDNPNLQNIPIRTEEGRKVRQAFIARSKGWVLLSADYSQIELRILAHMSGDKALVESFRKGEDIHRRTAALVHGLLPDLVTPELRNQAKVINYGLMYGMGAGRLGNETGMTPPEARKFIEAYFQALPGVKRYLDESLAQARRDLEVRTMFGRRRPLPDIHSDNAMQRVGAENMAVNSPIQGAAADIVKRAMLRVHAALLKAGLQARLLLQVHDELVFDVPETELELAKALIREAMMGAAELKVPLEVQMGTGTNWLAAH